MAYTYSKAMGTTSYNPVVPDNETWNYGRLSVDRRHNLQVNYSYDLPEPGKMLHSKLLAVFTDRWTLSGIFSMQSGAPFNPGGPNVNGTAPDYTGTPNVSARVNVVGDPMANVPAGYYYQSGGLCSAGAGIHHHHAGPRQPGRRRGSLEAAARHQPGHDHGQVHPGIRRTARHPPSVPGLQRVQPPGIQRRRHGPSVGCHRQANQSVGRRLQRHAAGRILAFGARFEF